MMRSIRAMARDAKAHFESAFRLLAWANEDINQLEVLWQAFICADPNPYRVVKELDPASGSYFVSLLIDSDIPDLMLKLIHNSSNAIKHAFDHAMVGFVIDTDPAISTNNCHFPWAEGVNDLKGKLRRMSLPKKIDPIFVGFDAYSTRQGERGGDDILRSFAKAVNPAKHELIVQVKPTCSHVGSQMRFIAGVCTDGWSIDFLDPPARVSKDKIMLAALHGFPHDQYDINVTVDVAFGEAGAIQDRPVLEVLRYCANRAGLIVQRLSAPGSVPR
jgi:hypothetical protein